MTGLDKITDKILAEAEADARALMEQAEEKSREILGQYRESAEQIREKLSAQAQREGENIISRAKSAAAMEKRNILLTARAELIDRAFQEAYQSLCSLPEEQYVSFLVKLLTGALLGRLEEEKNHRALYGEEDLEPVEQYEVLLNARDRAAYGVRLLEGVRRAVVGKVGADELEKLVLSECTVKIDGGVILKCGDVESNCSLEMIFAGYRDRLEGEVSRMLFEEGGKDR